MLILNIPDSRSEHTRQSDPENKLQLNKVLKRHLKNVPLQVSPWVLYKYS
jgi:hypothetical protein